MSDIIYLNEENFEKTIKENKIVVVDFWAEWCGPCQMFSSIFEDFAKDNSEIVCAKLNIDEAPNVASKYNVLSIPTIIIFKDGKIENQQTGAIPKSLLQDFVNKCK
jgi:thioredoxin 1